jgi:hypothetical protein
MKPAVIVLLVVSQGDLAEPAMIALRRAAERALGTDSRIVVHEQTAPLSDDDAIGLAEQMRASVVVEITWPTADRTSARVHVHFAERPGWLDRDLAFAPNEPITERGRTLGFEIASMVPDAPPPEASAEARPGSNVSSEQSVLPVVQPPRPTQWAADVSVAGSVGVRGDATAVGLALGGQWISARGVFARLGANGRFGSIDAPGMSASSTNLSVGPGVGFLAGWPVSQVRAGAHADALLVYSQVTRSASTPPAETKSRFLPGAALMLDGEIAASPVVLAAGVGLEFAFGTTDVRLGQEVVASIPRVRALGELGVRYRF